MLKDVRFVDLLAAVALVLLSAVLPLQKAYSLPSNPLANPPDAPGDVVQYPDTLRPLKITTPPVIDGVFDEPFWSQATKITGFMTFIPDFGKTPKEQTEARVAYDNENIYFAYRCYDDPKLIKTSLSPRDNMTTDDFICINLDAKGDQQGLNAFYVNPSGIQGDSRFAAGIEDFSPDYVWYSAGKIDSGGYSIEVQLPLKSLRYNNDDPTTMGIIFERFISRRGEHSGYPHLDPNKGFALLTEMYPMSFSGIEHYKLVEILPAFTALRQDVRQENTLVKDKQKGEFSLTGKYGITSDLILDGTINPDFSQVESDAGQIDINLRYSLFYPEKRSFFLEGKDQFNNAANFGLLDPTVFYSRTIADPSFGTKLTGALGTNNTLATIYVVDRTLDADRPTLGDYVRYPIVRFKRALNDDSYLGFFYAGREFDNGYNRVGGLDEIYRLSDAITFESNGYLTWAKDSPGSSAVNGHTAGFRLSHEARNLDYYITGREVSDDFRADMGYVARTGLTSYYGFLRPKVYTEYGPFNRYDIEGSATETRDNFSTLWEHNTDIAVTAYTPANLTFRARAAYATEVFNNQVFQVSGIHAQVKGRITKQLSVSLLGRKIRSIYYPASQQGRSNVLNLDVVLQPTDNFQAEGSYVYSDFYPDDTGIKLYDYGISRLKLVYQVNQSLFFRAIGQYNSFRSEFTPDLLASFTYIPGTVVYLGYGAVADKVHWDGTEFSESDKLITVQQALFLKLSYLWRS